MSKVGSRGEAGEAEFLSPALQREAAQNLSRLHGWQFDDELTTLSTDLDVSGRKGNLHKRTGLNALLAAATQGRVHHVIVYKLSRLARSAREGLEIFDIFEQLGVAVHVVKEGIDSSTASGRMIRTMLLGVAEMQSEDISQFARDAARQRALQGRPHSTPSWITKTETGYELVPTVAETVRRLVDLRMSGLSYSQIAWQLNKEARLTVAGKLWRGSNVAQYLNADSLRKMRGDSVYGTHLAPGDPARIELPGVFPALLTQEEHSDLTVVQRTLLERAVWNEESEETNRRKGIRHAYTLGSGLVVCSICGTRLLTHRQSYKTTAGNQAVGYTCRGAGDLNIAHPSFGRSMAQTEEGKPDQRQMSLASELVDSAILQALIFITARLLPDLSTPEFSMYGLSICGLSICGKLGYGKPSFLGVSVDGAIPENQVYTRGRARSSSSSLSISYVIESKTYETKDDDDILEGVQTTAPTRPRTRKTRSVETITADIDDLFGLRSRGRITEGDFDRRYQKLVAEREESAAAAAEQAAASASQVGVGMLRRILTEPDAADEVISSVSVDRWRLAAQLLFEKIEAPIFLPVKMAPQTGDHKDRARRDRRAMALWLRTPLETGEVVVVSGMYRGAYTGERFCEAFTKAQFKRLIKPWKPEA